MQRASRLLQRALAQAPEHARARAYLANWLSMFEYAVPGADAQFARAFEADPADAELRWLHAQHLLSVGRRREALDEFEVACTLEPSNYHYMLRRAAGTYLAGDAAGARERLRALAGLADPPPPPSLAEVLVASDLGGLDASVVAALDEVGEREPHFRPVAALAHAVAGDVAAARSHLDALERLSNAGAAVLATVAALAALRLGDRAGAYRWLERAPGDLCPAVPFAALLPGFAPLHNEPRFRALLRRIGREAVLDARGPVV